VLCVGVEVVNARQWKRWRSARRCADTLPTEKARVNAEKTAECLPRELQAGPKTQSMLGARKEKKKSHRNVRCKWDDGGIGKTASVRGEGAQEALARQRSDIWGDGAKLSVLWLFCTPDPWSPVSRWFEGAANKNS